MRHFCLILVVTVCATTACRTPMKPRGPRPTMPIMKVASISSSIVYSYTLEVEANELPAEVQTIKVATAGEKCVMDRRGFCALPITSDEVRFTVAGFTASGRPVNICAPRALAVDFVHRYDADKTIGARILVRKAQAERQDGQCVFTLVERYATRL